MICNISNSTLKIYFVHKMFIIKSFKQSIRLNIFINDTIQIQISQTTRMPVLLQKHKNLNFTQKPCTVPNLYMIPHPPVPVFYAHYLPSTLSLINQIQFFPKDPCPCATYFSTWAKMKTRNETEPNPAQLHRTLTDVIYAGVTVDVSLP